VLLVSLVEGCSYGTVGDSRSLLELEGSLDSALLLSLVNDIYHVQHVSAIHAVEPIAHEIILSKRLCFSETASELVFHLEFSLLHLVNFAANLGSLVDDTMLHLQVLLSLDLCRAFGKSNLRHLGVLDVLVDKDLYFFVLFQLLALQSLFCVSRVLFFAQLLLVSLVHGQLLQSVWLLVL